MFDPTDKTDWISRRFVALETTIENLKKELALSNAKLMRATVSPEQLWEEALDSLAKRDYAAAYESTKLALEATDKMAVLSPDDEDISTLGNWEVDDASFTYRGCSASGYSGGNWEFSWNEEYIGRAEQLERLQELTLLAYTRSTMK